LTLRAGPPPQSTLASVPAPSTFRSWSWPTWGFVPLRDFTAPRPLAASTSQALATFRPRTFSAPRRFSPRCGSQACSIPLPRAGFARSGASLPAQPFFPRREELPPCRSALVRSPDEPAATMRAPRLRGFAPREVALSHGLVLPAPRLAPLLEFSSPPGANLPPCRVVTHAAPLMTLPKRDLRLRDGPVRPSSASHRRRS